LCNPFAAGGSFPSQEAHSGSVAQRAWDRSSLSKKNKTPSLTAQSFAKNSGGSSGFFFVTSHSLSPTGFLFAASSSYRTAYVVYRLVLGSDSIAAWSTRMRVALLAERPLLLVMLCVHRVSSSLQSCWRSALMYPRSRLIAVGHPGRVLWCLSPCAPPFFLSSCDIRVLRPLLALRIMLRRGHAVQSCHTPFSSVKGARAMISTRLSLSSCSRPFVMQRGVGRCPRVSGLRACSWLCDLTRLCTGRCPASRKTCAPPGVAGCEDDLPKCYSMRVIIFLTR